MFNHFRTKDEVEFAKSGPWLPWVDHDRFGVTLIDIDADVLAGRIDHMAKGLPTAPDIENP